jgi:nucleosome binding factor SPN SPT16 subunit
MDCLVHLTDPPFTVVTLSEIEVASMERVQFGLKQFDLVFVFRDFTRVPLSINSIPSTQLNNVMEWLK